MNQSHRVGIVGGALVATAVVSLGAMVKPMCDTDLCRDAFGYLTENRSPTPTTEQPGGAALATVHMAGTALASTTATASKFIG